MKKSSMILASLVLSAAWFGTAAIAEEKSPPPGTVKEIDKNDKIRVTSSSYEPGQGGAMTKWPMRVVHYDQGGVVERTYEDGSKETVTISSGDTVVLNIAKPYSWKNVGKTTLKMVAVWVN